MSSQRPLSSSDGRLTFSRYSRVSNTMQIDGGGYAKRFPQSKPFTSRTVDGAVPVPDAHSARRFAEPRSYHHAPLPPQPDRIMPQPKARSVRGCYSTACTCSCSCHTTPCYACGCSSYSFYACGSSSTQQCTTSCKCACHRPGTKCFVCGCKVLIVYCPALTKPKCPAGELPRKLCAEIFKTDNTVSPPEIKTCTSEVRVGTVDEDDANRDVADFCHTLQIKNDCLPVYLEFEIDPTTYYAGAFVLAAGKGHNISRWKLEYLNTSTNTWLQAYPDPTVDAYASSNETTLAEPYHCIDKKLWMCLPEKIRATSWRLCVLEYENPAKNGFSICLFDLQKSKPCGGCHASTCVYCCL